MSTGPGKTQRAILKALQGADIHGLEMDEVTRSVYGDTWTEAQRSSIARAVRNLELRGFVSTYWDGGVKIRGERMWSGTPSKCVRLPLS
jgi:DNA-binding PadR family transcriptional regulator